MERIIKMLGSMTLSAVIILLPILCTLSFVYSWDSLVEALLITATLAEYCILWLGIWKVIDDEEVENGNDVL